MQKRLPSTAATTKNRENWCPNFEINVLHATTIKRCDLCSRFGTVAPVEPLGRPEMRTGFEKESARVFVELLF